MRFSPNGRKVALTLHVIVSVGWLGAVLAFLAISVTGLVAEDIQIVRSAYLMMNAIGKFALAPLALLTILTGVLQSLGTVWGLFKHYWVVMKLIITTVAILIFLLYLRTLESLATLAGNPSLTLTELKNPSPTVHAVLALMALLTTAALSVFKPRGLTRLGRGREASSV